MSVTHPIKRVNTAEVLVPWQFQHILSVLFLLHSLFKASTHLIWSVFGLTNLETLESHDIWSNTVVGILFVMFLVLSVIMLINMLVALLNNTYNKVEVNNVAVTFWSSKSVETFILKNANQQHSKHAYN